MGMSKESLEKYDCEDFIVALFKMFNIGFKAAGSEMGVEVWKNLHEFMIYPFLAATDDERTAF